MAFLVDLFSPSTILHMVSIANKYKFLSTDEKRFLIAFRMSSAYADGVYHAEVDLKNRFSGIFSRFMNQLGAGQRCDNHDCQVCERLQALRQDFHDSQSSQEFALFLQWFQKGGQSAVVSSESERLMVEEPAQEPSPKEAFKNIPLFQCNPQHPAIINLAGLLEKDISLFDSDDLRQFVVSLQQHGLNLLHLLGYVSTQESENQAERASNE